MNRFIFKLVDGSGCMDCYFDPESCPVTTCSLYHKPRPATDTIFGKNIPMQKYENRNCRCTYVPIIQSEFEWKKERFELLCQHCFDADDPLSEEREELDVWLKDNQPEDWQQCTRGNTKHGDEIRNRQNKKTYIVEHIYREHPCCSVWNEREEKTVVNFQLSYFDINLAEKSDHLTAEDC